MLINSSRVVLTVLEAENLSSGHQHAWARALLSLCAHVMGWVRELSGVSLTRALIPFMRAPSTRLYHPLPPKAPPLNIIRQGKNRSDTKYWKQNRIWNISLKPEDNGMMTSIPSPGRFRIPRSSHNYRSPRSRTHAVQEMPPWWEACTTQLNISARESPCTITKTQHNQK